jgi:hypothetical protein
MAEPDMHSGSTGKIVIAGSPAKELSVTDWKREQQPEMAKVPHSLSGKRMRRKLVVKDDMFTFTCVWDANLVPEDCTLNQGDSLVADFGIGDSGKGYAAVPLITERCLLVGATQTNVCTFDVTAYVNGPWTPAVTTLT